MAPSKTTGTFFNTDFAKGFGAMSANMPFDIQGLMDLQRKNFQALSEAQQSTIESMQAMAQKQAEMLSQMVEENSKLAKKMMAEGSTEEKVALQADIIKKSYEKSMMNAQEIAEMMSVSNQKASEIIGKRISSSLKEMKTTMEKAGKQAKAA